MEGPSGVLVRSVIHDELTGSCTDKWQGSIDRTVSNEMNEVLARGFVTSALGGALANSRPALWNS